MQRREFLKQAGMSFGAAASVPQGRAQTSRVTLVAGPDDAVAGAPPARWAAGDLEQALAARGVAVVHHASLREAEGFAVVAADAASFFARTALGKAGVRPPVVPEAFALAPAGEARHPATLACAADARGLVYALLELADRVRHSPDAVAALAMPRAAAEAPANPVRSVTRLFVSDVEDKGWFHDRAMWPEYLSMLAAQRFNRFNLSFGIGYDFLREVTDAYLLFAYPFLLAVPGYRVRAVGLADTERDRNLETLRFIAAETAARGMEFQLGLWTHGYQWTNSPKANYTIEGLSAENHAVYCRDALAALLRECPAISGVTFRIHGESGVAEGNYSFWKTVFEGAAGAGRPIRIDLHSKGIDQAMIDTALASGMPVTVSPKYWAEHLGLPYHQAAIRDLEMPRADRAAGGFFALSNGSRSFTRYGVADLLREDRRYAVVHRIWPGTQRLLLWGDPLHAAAYSRAFGFCGSSGVEIMEPLSFKGRRGSGRPGGRCAYAEAGLNPHWDWQKYEYSYRVWGRLLYHPEADAGGWQRYLRSEAGDAAAGLGAALASAGRILPIVTTAHGASAANNNYWPEMYTNQPIVSAAADTPYTDSPQPRTFGNVSPFDPQLFSGINEYAAEMLRGERTGKYTPVEAAGWLEDIAGAAVRSLAAAESRMRSPKPGFRRAAVDVSIQAGLGRFFAAKFRAGVLYALHERTGERAPLEEAIRMYREARTRWAELARAGEVYVADVTVGELSWLRGHWRDRLPAIDADIEAMSRRLESAQAGAAGPRMSALIAQVLASAPRRPQPCRHTPPARFEPGRALALELAFDSPVTLASASLWYRRVNQAERYHSETMRQDGARYAAAIPADYTATPYPLEYYFELKTGPEKAWLYPGFNPDLANQPYFVVRRA